jgi:type IV fimbrial biogenesis protein FimT
MMKRSSRSGFTLIEVMVVVAMLIILLAVGVPSFRDLILVQRLKGINAQLVTDMNFARSEAISRNTWLRVQFGKASDNSKTCYTLYTTLTSDNSVSCNCLLGVGAACGVGATEVRSVELPASLSVQILTVADVDPAFAFDPVTGAISSIPTDAAKLPIDNFVINASISGARTLRTTVGRAGRPTVCATASGLGASLCG